MAAAKEGKKRAAPAQVGPARKKAHLEWTSKTQAAEKKAVHRKRPVTAPIGQENDSEDEESPIEEEETEIELNDEEDVTIVDRMDVDEATQKQSTGASARESHKVQKALQQERRAAKQHSALLRDAKRLWAQARQKSVKRQERQKHIQDLMDVVRGRVQDIVFKHDASRIIQTIVKYGDQKQRDEIAAELKGKYKELSQNKYSKFLVTKLIRSSPIHRTSILLEFKGHIVRLLLHRESSSVIADAYELYANAYERALLLFDFYGKEVQLFTPAVNKGTSADEKEKAKLREGLRGVLEGADTEKRKRVLAAVKEILNLVLNNSEKGAIAHAIFHRVLWEYLSQINEIDDEAEQEKLRREIFDACQEVLAEMVHTKDGSRVVREFIAQGTAKDRKQIVKVLKPHVDRICKDDEAQLVLFTALDVIDDTKMVAKSLVLDVVGSVTTLYTSPQGRRALFYLLVPRSRRHFTPAQIALLTETDPIKARTSKKEDSIRREEILKAASPGLIKLIETSEGAEAVIKDPGGSLLVAEIMLFAEGDKSKATSSLMSLLEQPYPSVDESKPHVIDVPHSCRAYKTLLQGGHFSQQTKTIERAPLSAFSPAEFASAWLKGVGKENTRAMGRSGGAFVLAALCECIKEGGTNEEKMELNRWFDESFQKSLDLGVKGRAVLIEAILR